MLSSCQIAMVQQLFSHWHSLVKNIGLANLNLGGHNVVKTDKCMCIPRFLGGVSPGYSSKVYAYAFSSCSYNHCFCRSLASDVRSIATPKQERNVTQEQSKAESGWLSRLLVRSIDTGHESQSSQLSNREMVYELQCECSLRKWLRIGAI